MNPMPFTGLSSAEAAARLRSDGYNELPAAERRGVIDLVRGDRMEAILL